MIHSPCRAALSSRLSRRYFLASAASTLAATRLAHAAAPQRSAQIAITLDLEMSRNFPQWETTRWDYEKGNLDEPTKRYTREACRRVKRRGGIIHCFAVGRVLEQENVDWLREIAEEGHPIGNHTYDHVNVTATARDQIQYRFQRAPWLIEGQSIPEVIRRNIRMTTRALEQRIGVKPAGFRTPGGFSDGLDGRNDLQRMLLELGYTWISSQYPRHPIGPAGESPSESVLAAIEAAQAAAQPRVYPSGLIEIPMSPISDIGAFRSGRWKLEDFLRATERSVRWAIEHRAVFDFLGHPSCLSVVDPQFKTIDLICRLVSEHADRAQLVSLDQIAAGR